MQKVKWRRGIALFALLVFAAKVGYAQEQTIDTVPNIPRAAGHSPDQAVQSQLPAASSKVHKFWDYENILLFAGVAGARGLDYSSTLNLRRRGLNEALLNNSIVDNHLAFAGIEAAGTAASIGVSYMFHRTGHHRLERWTSIVHIGVAVGGAGRNYAIKTNHFR